jgi:uncharacterized damage-inducible protein DinB
VRCLAASLLCAAGAWAQSAAQNPFSTEVRQLYEAGKRNLLAAAEQMNEADYAFKPTPEVRSFGQLIAHVAEYQFIYCGQVKGEQQQPTIERDKHTKTELIAALREGFAYCDPVYAQMTDAVGAQSTGRRTKLVQLMVNVSHNNEHYGNIVTYMRMRGKVPPSSQ